MIDLYAFGTPNGEKISIALEEMGLEYTFHKINILKGDQHKPEFLKINPNGKIPAIVDNGLAIFESIAILIYLAEKTGKFLPKDTKGRFETLQWCMFQAAGVGPMFGQFGHFSKYAKEKLTYAIERYSTEAQRLLGVMEAQLKTHKFLAGDEYTIADMATWPWIEGYQIHYGAKIDAAKFPNLARWAEAIGSRPAVIRGVAALK